MERLSLRGDNYAAGSSFSAWAALRRSRRQTRDIFALPSTFHWNIRWITDGNSPRRTGLVLRSASTYLLIVMGLLWYLSDGTKLQFGWEAQMSTEPRMLYERSRPSKANREEVSLTPSEACRLIAICIDLIDLCAKVTGKIDPAIASIVGYARDEALAEALEIGS
jgi:hypothetical protein